jgi:precorrin-6A synthase
MRTIAVVGIGSGDPEHLTLQAVRVLGDADVVLLLDKGGAARELLEVRQQICERYVSGRIVTVEDAGIAPHVRAHGYDAGVRRAREQRAARLAEVIAAELPAGGSAAVLAWGDPTIYESTLDLLRGLDLPDLAVEVVPGISSVQVLAARHRIPLNGQGERIALTPARRLAEGLPDAENVVVLLDGSGRIAELDDDLEVWWGGWLGRPQEVLVHGRLGDVRDEILAAREAGRRAHGWVFDTYLLRRPDGGG